MPNRQTCPNCGKPGQHWVPRFEGVPGYFVCMASNALVNTDYFGRSASDG